MTKDTVNSGKEVILYQNPKNHDLLKSIRSLDKEDMYFSVKIYNLLSDYWYFNTLVKSLYYTHHQPGSST